MNWLEVMAVIFIWQLEIMAMYKAKERNHGRSEMCTGPLILVKVRRPVRIYIKIIYEWDHNIIIEVFSRSSFITCINHGTDKK